MFCSSQKATGIDIQGGHAEYMLIVASKKVSRSEFPQSSRPRDLWKIATHSSSQDAGIPLPGISHADIPMPFVRFSRSGIHIVSRNESSDIVGLRLCYKSFAPRQGCYSINLDTEG